MLLNTLHARVPRTRLPDLLDPPSAPILYLVAAVLGFLLIVALVLLPATMSPQPPLLKVPLSFVLATAAVLGYISWIPFLGFVSFLIACVVFPQPPLLKGREQWVRGWLIKTLYRYSSFKVVYQDGHQEFTRKTAAVGELYTRRVR